MALKLCTSESTINIIQILVHLILIFIIYEKESISYYCLKPLSQIVPDVMCLSSCNGFNLVEGNNDFTFSEQHVGMKLTSYFLLPIKTNVYLLSKYLLVIVLSLTKPWIHPGFGTAFIFSLVEWLGPLYQLHKSRQVKRPHNAFPHYLWKALWGFIPVSLISELFFYILPVIFIQGVWIWGLKSSLVCGGTNANREMGTFPLNLSIDSL